MAKKRTQRVYVTATDATTKRSRTITVPAMTPTRLIRLLARISRGEAQVIDTVKAATAA